MRIVGTGDTDIAIVAFHTRGAVSAAPLMGFEVAGFAYPGLAARQGGVIAMIVIQADDALRPALTERGVAATTGIVCFKAA